MTHLRRFFCTVPSYSGYISPEERYGRKLLEVARVAANACPTLTVVGDKASGVSGRYVLVQVIRSQEEGGDDDLVLATGPASLLLLRQDQAFFA
jgi:hypothetical protein